MARDTLSQEPVQLDTICDGKLWDEFHDVQEKVLGTMPNADDDPETGFYHPTKAREITIKVLYEPKDGGVAIGYQMEAKIPGKKRSRGGFAQFDVNGKLVQFAARQSRLPGVGRAEPERKVTPIRAVTSDEQ
jgi:hypothetical protein